MLDKGFYPLDTATQQCEAHCPSLAGVEPVPYRFDGLCGPSGGEAVVGDVGSYQRPRADDRMAADFHPAQHYRIRAQPHVIAYLHRLGAFGVVVVGVVEVAVHYPGAEGGGEMLAYRNPFLGAYKNSRKEGVVAYFNVSSRLPAVENVGRVERPYPARGPESYLRVFFDSEVYPETTRLDDAAAVEYHPSPPVEPYGRWVDVTPVAEGESVSHPPPEARKPCPAVILYTGKV